MADLLNIGRSGLTAAKSNLNTTGHNIANANTEGFSRQRVGQQASPPVTKHGLNQGSGVRISGINRIHDQFVEKRLNTSISNLNHFEERASQLKELENIFNELDSDGLSSILNKFYNSFRELSNQPENETLRSIVRDTAGMVVKDFNRIRNGLDTSAQTIDRRLEMEVEDINSIVRTISELNKKIAVLEAGGEQTGDLRDQRDLQVRELSKSFSVQTYQDNRNNYIVSAIGVGTLVAGGEYQELQAGPTSKDQSSNNMDGSFEIYFKDRTGSAITSKFKHGRLASMLEVRNKEVKNLQESVDKIAYEFAESVNALHRRGHTHSPNTSTPSRSGINFFAPLNAVEGAAYNLSLSREVNEDLANIVTAMAPNSPGDNRVSIAISKLQHERIANGGAATLEESYLQTVGRIGIEAGKAAFDAEQAEGIQAQAHALRERISGVSLDEEAAELVRHQHAFQASAKVIQTADEMFQTIMGLKR